MQVIGWICQILAWILRDEIEITPVLKIIHWNISVLETIIDKCLLLEKCETSELCFNVIDILVYITFDRQQSLARVMGKFVVFF